MSDLVNTLVSQTGIDSDKVRSGLGALLAFLKEHLGEETFKKIEAALPQVGGLLEGHQALASSEGGGGLVEMVTGLAGKLLGGQALDVSKLIASLSSAGLSLDQIKSFIPRALEFLEAHLPAQVIDAIKAAVLGGSAPTSTKV